MDRPRQGKLRPGGKSSTGLHVATDGSAPPRVLGAQAGWLPPSTSTPNEVLCKHPSPNPIPYSSSYKPKCSPLHPGHPQRAPPGIPKAGSLWRGEAVRAVKRIYG